MMNRKILLIEDNEQNRYLVTFLLQARGWEIVHAEDGPAGLALADRIDPALGKPIDPEAFGVAVETFLKVGHGGEKP
jgi:CheY-like chemotaxis protein